VIKDQKKHDVRL